MTPSADRDSQHCAPRARLLVFLTAAALAAATLACSPEPASPPAQGVESSEPSSEGAPGPSPNRGAETTGVQEESSAEVPEAGSDPPDPGADDRLPEISSVVEIDERAGELQVPCLFVNPTQALEVFGCHWYGPAHETIVAYLAEGKAIFDGLVRLGLRSPKFWNASSRVAEGRPDVRYILGDRVVAFLRWEREGKTHFRPAEKILREIGTGFSPFVRGFTFSGQEVLVGDPPRPGIPPHVEITIGGPTRGEKAVSSILFHPNDLQELTRWMAPLEVDAESLPDLRELVEERVPCTLVLRRVDGEVALLDLALQYESDAERRALLESLRPTAEEIDLRKGAHARRVQRIVELTARSDEELADPESLAKVEKELLELIGGARLERDVVEIWRLYLKLFTTQESFRRRVLEKSSLDEWQLAQVRGLNDRLSFEPLFVELELKILQLRGQESPLSEKDRLLEEGFAFELEQRRHEAELPLARLELEDISRRLSELDPDRDAWSFQVQEEYRRDILARVRLLKSRALELSTRSRESRARAEGDWPALRDEVLEERERALAGVALAEREAELVELDRELRWSSHDEDSDRLSDEKKVEIREKVGQLKERRASLLKEIDEKRGSLESADR